MSRAESTIWPPESLNVAMTDARTCWPSTVVVDVSATAWLGSTPERAFCAVDPVARRCVQLSWVTGATVTSWTRSTRARSAGSIWALAVTVFAGMERTVPSIERLRRQRHVPEVRDQRDVAQLAVRDVLARSASPTP